ncbi:stage V sporulation protein S [Virgibacillus profundi]|uniref:Stage V sporulation protein S n=1 Tax=Virgibacillus profundi TaxID=2024555 RepID=A0A2A2IJM9_9BACI|nr:lasso peptide biosynthesis B2 protein [Virgibacillus profundi]PAV31526.1 stage V sporulation protein S [Virgibacillus profundi]PXY55712.1 lasso peptide biosynthesis B2 protein [Virgibacillus profundi]
MRKIKLLLSLHPKMILLLLEAYIYLAWARVLKGKSFSKIASSLGDKMKETSKDLIPEQRRKQAEVSQAIRIMSKYTFWESECLVKAIAALKMLEKRNIESTLYLGTAKDGAGKLIAHAWLRSGPFYITGAEVKERFTVVSKFAKMM